MANPVSKTAYYCTGVRMLDAQSDNPLVGDRWAERFMDEEGRRFFDEFRSYEIPNASNITRHHIIDEILRARLAADSRRRIVLLGAGFDARAFRLTGGDWFEVDEAPIIERKNTIAPASQAPNSLTRIAIDFAKDSIADTLAPLATSAPMTVVMEGVLYYLELPAIERTLAALRQLFPHHELVCDLQSEKFVTGYGGPIIKRISEHGAKWRWYPADPIREIEQRGYRLESATSVPLRGVELKRIKIPRFAVRWVMRSLRDGYRVCVFSR
jgi:methyltransferase (TIGR00027 family)